MYKKDIEENTDNITESMCYLRQTYYFWLLHITTSNAIVSPKSTKRWRWLPEE